MAVVLEPLPLNMERSSANRQGKDHEHVLVDYSKLPRSSGDGMEFTLSSSSEGSSSEDSDESDQLKQVDKLPFPNKTKTKTQSPRNNVVDRSPENRTVSQDKHTSRNEKNTKDLRDTQRTLHSIAPSDGINKVKKANNEIKHVSATTTANTESSAHSTHVYDRQNSVNLLLQGAEIPSHGGLRVPLGENEQLVSLAPPASDVTFAESLVKCTVVEQNAQFVDSHKVVNDLEEQNSKLVEEKTKLSVQLGVQTKVNAELKNLLVASVGEDIGDRLEDLVTRNTQQTVELNHWKKMCEEYSEESDRLEIECDVWRTKFVASRMMSDELSSWKVALYTRFRQAQSALERLLEERSQLQQYLVHTRRLIQSLYSMLKCTNGPQPTVATASPSSHEQSILEMASINTSLARETWDLAENVLPTLSLAEASMMLTQTQENREELHMEPTPAEKLAIQVLSSDVDLQVEEQQLRGVMKRMGQQYMGHGYHGRFSTKNFRVTYDCCNRCTGALHVV